MACQIRDDANCASKLGPVQLITPSESGSGLSRYATQIALGLRRAGVDIQQRWLDSPPNLTSSSSRLGRIRGFPKAFFGTYPLQVRLDNKARLYHLTVQTFAMMLLSQRLSSPVIITVHDIAPYLLRRDRELNIFPHAVDAVFYRLALTGLRRASRIIVCSEYTKRTLVETLRLPPERITVVYHGIDHSQFHPVSVPEDFYDRYGLDRSCRYILYVGSEQPRKNFLTLARAFARLRKSHADVRLLKVGRPEYELERRRALALVEELGIGTDVVFRGQVPDQDLPYFYNAAHVFVFPSRFEGFGFPPLEAMACGTPVLCSNATSLPEVVSNAALHFEPTNEEELLASMVLLLSDENARHDYSRRGIENAGRFTWDLTVQQTLDVYRQTIK